MTASKSETPGTQSVQRQALRALQFEKLCALLTGVLPDNRFYATKLGRAGVSAADISGLEDLQRIPFTTKDELQEDQAENPPYGSNLSLSASRYRRLHQTSGSTGAPIRWLDTEQSWQAHLDCWQVIYDAAGVGPADRFLFPFSFGPFIGFWAAFDGAVRRGNLCLPGGGLSTSARVRWLVEHEVTVVASTPTYALRLAEVAETEGIDLPSSPVRTLIVAGEPGGSVPEVKERIEKSWGARCYDHWGMTEVGPLGFEPRDRPGGMHLIETHCIAEVVDVETQEALRGPGRGELVMTTLERHGSPLLRYRTGDLVEMAEDEAPEAEESTGTSALRIDALTGTPFTRFEGGILGRVDQMVLVRGNNVYPGAIDAIVKVFPRIVEYRAEVRDSQAGTALKLEIELGEDSDRAATDSGTDVAENLTRAIQDRLFFRPEVKVVKPGSLPRQEFKARRFFIIRE